MAKDKNNYGSMMKGMEEFAKTYDAIFASMKPIPTKKQQRKLDAIAAREKEKTFIVKVTVKEADVTPETVETIVVEAANEAAPAKPVEEAKPEVKPEPKAEVKAEPVKTEVKKEEVKPSIPKVTPPAQKQEKKAETKPQDKPKVETKPQQPQKSKQEKAEAKPEKKAEKKPKVEKPKLVAAQIAGIAPDGRALDSNGTPMVSASGLPLVMNPATGRFEEAIPLPPPVAQQPAQAQA